MAKSPAKKLAKASFFCGLGSLVFGVLTGIPAIILGHRSNRISRLQGHDRRPLARIGIILGYLSFLLTIFGAIVLLKTIKTGKWIFGYKKGLAQSDTRQIVEAIETYRKEYAVLPLIIEDQPHDTTDSDSALIDVLIGNSRSENSRNIEFLPNSNRWNFAVPRSEDGTADPGAKLFDPWGNPYFVVMDTDGDGSIDDPTLAGRRIRGRLAIAWSAGPDGKIVLGKDSHPDNKDNIYSWK